MFAFITDWFPDSRYRLLGRLEDTDDVVHTLAFSPDGKILASGGSGGMRLYSTDSWEQMPIPGAGRPVQLPISVAAWSPSCVTPTLALGTIDGSIIVWMGTMTSRGTRFQECFSARLGDPAKQPTTPVSAIAWQGGTRSLPRVAVMLTDGSIKLFSMTETGTLIPVFASQSAQILSVPVALKFTDPTKEDELCLFGPDGELYTVGEGGKATSKLSIAPTIHDVDMLNIADKNPVVLVDAGRGELITYEWHRQNAALAPLRTFNVTRNKKHLHTSRALFADNGRKIVAGSDHGTMYVFDRDTGRLVYWLRSGSKGPIQRTAICNTEERDLVAAAVPARRSSPGSACAICIWSIRKDSGKPQEDGRDRIRRAFRSVGAFLFKATIILLALLYIKSCIEELMEFPLVRKYFNISDPEEQIVAEVPVIVTEFVKPRVGWKSAAASGAAGGVAATLAFRRWFSIPVTLMVNLAGMACDLF